MSCGNVVALGLAALLSAATAGCGDQPDAAATEAPAHASSSRMTTKDYRAARAKSADSLIKTAKPTSKVVEDLGTQYVEAPTALRDSLAILASKAGCFETGRGSDPYLAGTARVYVYMSVVGSQIVRVENSRWTSAAGNVVTACLNLAAKGWKFGTEHGKSGILVALLAFK